jgi:hypothetical protein
VHLDLTRDPNWLGPAIPPGEMLLEEFLKPMGIGQVEAARQLGIFLNRLNEIVLGKRGITANELDERRPDAQSRTEHDTALASSVALRHSLRLRP